MHLCLSLHSGIKSSPFISLRRYYILSGLFWDDIYGLYRMMLSYFPAPYCPFKCFDTLLKHVRDLELQVCIFEFRMIMVISYHIESRKMWNESLCYNSIKIPFGRIKYLFTYWFLDLKHISGQFLQY